VEAEVTQTKQHRKLNISLVLVTIFIIAICAFALLTIKERTKINDEILMLQYTNYNLEEKNNELNEKLVKINAEIQEMRMDFLMRKLSGLIDFSTSNVQEIGNGFFLVKAEQEEHLTGIRFKGRVINAQSIAHNNVEFKLTASENTKEFTINQISAGNSTEFSVYIPDVKASDVRFGRVEYVSSSISYYMK
jgi:hypothetical protein